MRVKPAVASLLLLATLAFPGTARAQLVSADDPCYKKLLPFGFLEYLLEAKWSDTQQLGWALFAVRDLAAAVREGVEAAQRQVAEGKPLSTEELADLKDINDCLPWLIALATRLDNELKRRGVSSIEASPLERNRGRAKAQERERVAKETAAALAKAAEGLRMILKPR